MEKKWKTVEVIFKKRAEFCKVIMIAPSDFPGASARQEELWLEKSIQSAFPNEGAINIIGYRVLDDIEI